MRRRILKAWLKAGACFALASGCATGPLLDNPVSIGEPPPPNQPNPTFVAMGAPDYGCVFETCLDVIDDFFEISLANRYDGRIRTFPKVAPGLEQPWRPGSPDGAERFRCTLQSYAYVCDIVIQPGDSGGYMISVTVNKFLEDLPQPLRATAGVAAFRSDNDVDRRYEVVDPERPESNWIPKGREPYLEQEIIRKIGNKLNSRK
ncbi:MAG: hypothetical protein ACJ8C4_11440 [Gemmataceae bacterium]